MSTVLPREPSGFSPAERNRFDVDGFLVVPSALASDEVAVVRSQLAVLAADATGYGYEHQESGLLLSGGSLQAVTNPLAKASIVLDVALHQGFFPRIADAFAGAVRLLSNEYFITPSGAKPRLGWHRDAVEGNFPAIDLASSLLFVNCLVLLSDVGEDNGATLVLPGSHRWTPEQRLPDEWPGMPIPDGLPGHVKLCGEAGTAVFFNARLWHAQSENRSSSERHALVFVYGYRWMRAFPGFEPTPEQADELAGTPIRAQLLGLGPAFDEPVAAYEIPERWAR